MNAADRSRSTSVGGAAAKPFNRIRHSISASLSYCVMSRGVLPSLSFRFASPPAFSTALAFYDQYRSAVLPANLLQAQRDYFGAHTYERVDKPRGEFFHTNWTGRGGTTSSSTYNV